MKLYAENPGIMGYLDDKELGKVVTWMEDMQKKLQVEIMRREEVRPNTLSTIILASSFSWQVIVPFNKDIK